MSPVVRSRQLSLCIQARRTRIARSLNPRCLWLVGFLIVASPLWAQDQTFEPAVTVGAGIQSSYTHNAPDGTTTLDQFSLNHARLYLSGDILKNISVMANTDYDSGSNTMQILDLVGQFHATPKFNLWFGRFLPPSDRANLYGPFYSSEWAVFTDGIQDGYPFVFQGRDNGAAYWGDFKTGITKIKISAGAFDGSSATKKSDILGAGRIQLDFWDPEDGYYLNDTYYGDKNLLAIAVASQVQAGKTATTADLLMEKKVKGGGALTLESEYSRYNGLGGYNANYNDSQGAYGLAAFLIPKQIGIGKFQLLGKFAIVEFTHGLVTTTVTNPSFRQNTTEVNLNYVIKQFDARVMAFGKNTTFNGVQKSFWQAGIGVQLQISKRFTFPTHQ